MDRYKVPDPRCDAEVLLSSVLDCRRGVLALHRDDIVPAGRLSVLKKMIVRRARREPVAYILGYTEFMGMRFFVNEHTLIPRPETELLVEEVVRLITGTGLSKKNAEKTTVADVCTGSGCIAVSIAKLLPGTRVHASDISKDALAIAGQNAVINGVSGMVMLHHGDMFEPFDREGLTGAFDIIVSNPPYVLSSELSGLEPELLCEPRSALDGGADGLRFYRQLALAGKQYLKPRGYIVVELNAQKSAQTAALFTAAGFAVVKTVKDYAHLDRILIVQSIHH